MKTFKKLPLMIPFFPFMYLYVTRLGTAFRFFQFFGGEILPITVMTYSLLNNGSLFVIFDVKFATFMLFSVFVYITFFTLYEIGYAINDCVAVKYDSNPSIRYVACSKWKFLVLSKSIFFFLLLMLTKIIFRVEVSTIIIYYAVTFFLFLLHNGLAVQDRGVSYFWLEFMRLMILPYVSFQDFNMLLIMIMLIFPELVRRSFRYVRIKYLSYDRKFSIFDLKMCLLSVFVVSIILFVFDVHLVSVLLSGYVIIVSGILISLYVDASAILTCSARSSG
jgi:hypothetical protein